MRYVLSIVLLMLALPLSAWAHPGTGIVMDPRGNVFFTDLVHVWRITPAGEKSIAVRDVHTHVLSMDRAGNLYGEDSRYLGGGDGEDRYRIRVWRRTPEGRVSDVVPWTTGFWSDYGFVRDRAGTTYWIRCPEQRCSIHGRRPGSTSSFEFAGSQQVSSRINWFTANPTKSGVLYVVDAGAVVSIDSTGVVRTIARGLGEHVMGLWATGPSLYAAVYGARAVVRINLADGTRRTVARSPAPWGPTGVLVAADGHLWVLEYSTSNEARVRRIAPDGTARVF